jgi:hypothetical protein
MPSLFAAARDKSITRPDCVGPRSLMRTIAVRWLRVFVTLTRVPNGSVGCAAVIPF